MAAKLDAKKIARTKLHKEIKEDLLDQLERNGTVGKFYINMIDDYMDMWTTKCLLIEDIKARGVTTKYDNGGGQSGFKKNDSIEQLVKINTQMLKILNELEIKPSTSYGTIGGDKDDNGEDEKL